AWKTARTGVFLNFISMCMYTGAWGVFLLMYILFMIALWTQSIGLLDFIRILSYLFQGLVVVSWVLCVIGSAYMIIAPGKHGEMGLAIATLSLGVMSVLLLFYSLYTSDSTDLFQVNALRGIKFVDYLELFADLARLSVFAIFQWAVARSTRDADLA